MKETAKIEKQIGDIILSKLKNPESAEAFTYDVPLISLGIDSILALSILVEIEECFDVEINDGDLNMDRIRNVHNFAELIRGYL